MESMKDTTPDWVANLIRDFQDKITRGVYEAIYDLEGQPLEHLMTRQARARGAAFLGLVGFTERMEVDEFLARIRVSGPSQIEIRRDGDVIDWTELHAGQCVCPLVKRGAIRLDRKLCLCGAGWVKYLFEPVTEVPVDVETVETVAAGSMNCRFEVRLKPPPRW